ncbi:MAG: IgGFc-binding protein, partial [Ignavibacteriota bacterium]
MLQLLQPSESVAQGCGGRGGVPPGSSGTKFLLVFMKNESYDYGWNAARYQDIYLASIDTFVHTKVTITCKEFPGWQKDIDLPPHGSLSYRLSTDPVIGFPGKNCIVESSDSIEYVVFKVVASAPISCYGMNNKVWTSDAFLALPYDPASTDYMVMAYTNSSHYFTASDKQPSEFSVASFDEHNVVTIIPAAATAGGHPKLIPMTFTLDSGDCVQIQADVNDSTADMTGSIVRAMRPVVVYSGSARTEMPNGFTVIQNGATGTSRDHLCEAMPPLSTWGTSFIAKNFQRADGDVLRVLASVDSTVITINGKIWGAPLNAKEYRDTIILQSNFAIDNIAVVESSHPILVGMFANTADLTAQTGDPFLAIVPPLEQTYNAFTYFITTDTATTGSFYPNEQFLIVATEESGAGKISIDGKQPYPRAAYTFLPNAIRNGKKYAVTTIKQTSGIHQIISQNQKSSDGFTILAYGWGNVISYGYTAGQLLIPLKGIIPLNEPTGNIPSPRDPAPKIPSIIVRNILAEKIYFDSARISYSQNEGDAVVRLKKDIALETGTLLMGQEKTLELTSSSKDQNVVSGKVRIWYHTAKWTNLMPVDFPFVLTPGTLADVTRSQPERIIF